MSKYIYTTIYEQFTGLKPPEPKNQKPRRRRGYGHPYRMRLNMQEDDQSQAELLQDEPQGQAEPAAAPKPFLKPPVSNSPVRNNRSGRTPGQSIRSRRTGNTGNNGSFQNHARAPMPEELKPNKSAEPKVTYKKRRHYSQPVMSAVPLGGDRKEPKDY